MSQFKIPNDERKFAQANDGDVGGNVWLSQNLDFKSNKGKLKPSPRTVINTSVTTTDYKIPAFARNGYDSTYWAIVGAKLYKTATTLPNAAFGEDAFTSTPTLDYRWSDMIYSGAAGLGLLVSNDSTIWRLASGGTSWSNFWGTTLSQTFSNTGSYRHPMEFLYNKSLAVADRYYIHTVVSPYSAIGNVTNPKLTLPTDEYILWIKSSSTRVWIGIYNTSGGEGLVYEWDGASTNTTRAYKVGATGALAGVIKDDIPWIMTSDGSLKKFNGAGFTTVAQLPHTSSGFQLKHQTDGARFIHPNGMKLIDGKINILINNLLDETTDYTNLTENEPSGIWEYDEEIGLYHKYSFTLDATGVLDSGQNCIGYAGALLETKKKECALLAGASVYTDNGSTLKHAIFNDELADTIAKVGVLVSPWFQSFQIEEAWQKLWLKFKDFDNTTDKIIVKYRTRKDEDLPAIYNATWTSTTTFTITSTSELQTATNILDTGNEVEIIMASGAGKSAHISSVSVAGTYTYTVTIDEAIGPASGTGKVRFNNWTKIETIDDQVITDKVISLGKKSTELQIKLELRGTGNNPEINQLVVLSGTQLPIK